MQITGVSTLGLSIPLKHPYHIAYQDIIEAKVLFLRVRTRDGIDGFGCASPEEAITGENFAAAKELLAGAVRDTLKGQDPLRRGLIIDRLAELTSGFPSVRGAVDMALLDILGKKARLPVWQLYGGYRRSIETSITLGIAPLDETLTLAKELTQRGFRVLKLKGGLSVEEDAEKLNRLRELTGPEAVLRFDANQGYSVSEALRLLELAAPAEIEILEQPTPRKSPTLLGHVTQLLAVPVMADESLQSLHEAFHLAREELVDMMNIKLTKVGGFTAARRIDAVAQAAGIESMVGCMDEPALGVAAGLHFALSHENVRYADLDSFLDLTDDPTAGAVRLKKGMLIPRSAPGFGCEPKIF
ncbi:dipeptide epimerase [Marispirochaeta sp.]|uniref:mandelate racemase/muconate lactonizing enzyme family protein n=1 Tax=Marispirochaeta sp. TaxID=2038653 RepID=UPI0029C8FB65|nr:dipeptide epimerase [Marispirochaeta sp.]